MFRLPHTDSSYTMEKMTSKWNCSFSIRSHWQALLTSWNRKNNHIHFGKLAKKQRLCVKKKVLMLGLDGVGKTDLFTRLINHEKNTITDSSLSQPTIGYNVETIKIHCKHICHRRHKITLWDCGGQPSVRSLWPYHYADTSLLLWLISIHDRSRLDTNLHLLSQILKNPLLARVPVLIVLNQNPLDGRVAADENNLMTNLEVAFRFLATLSTSRASTFEWQVINLNANDAGNDSLKKLRQAFEELMKL